MSIFAALSVAEMFGISGMGMLIVFSALVFLMFLIYALSAIIAWAESRGNGPAAVTAGATAGASLVPANGSAGEVALGNVDEATAAMLMAIVADDMKLPLNRLRFISIRQVD